MRDPQIAALSQKVAALEKKVTGREGARGLDPTSLGARVKALEDALRKAETTIRIVQGDGTTIGGDLADHLADPTDAHDASAISNVPAGGIAATNVQTAINELDTEKAAASHTHPVTALAFTATDRLAGRDTAGAGAGEELTVSGGVEFTGSGGIQTSAFTGDATKAAGGTVTTVEQARGLRETSGPTTLPMGNVAEGQYLIRSGGVVQGEDLNASRVPFSPTVDITATDTQAAIEESFTTLNGFIGGKLAAASNLSDVASAATSRTNLGVGTGDSPQFAAVNLSHASANTLTGSGGDAFIEGNLLYRAGGTDVPVTDGGTGASTVAGAQAALGFGNAVKTGDTARNTTASPTDDPHLTEAVDASSYYSFRVFGYYTSGAGGLQAQINVPTGATGRVSADAGSVNAATSALGAAFTLTAGAQTTRAFQLTGFVKTDVTAGSLAFAWDRNTASGTTTLFEGSHLVLTKLS